MRQQRRRLDRELVNRGLAQDEPEALRLIAGRRVLVGGAPALQPSRMVAPSDLSFISLVAVLDRLVAVAAPGADLVLLVKPQFEAPRADVAPGGVVEDPAVWAGALERVAAALGTRGVGTAAIAPSRLRGAEG